jgi:prepilin-type N-terminal cleavage/methylation domain-containing protein
MRDARRQAGFTLTEMMIVVAIIAVLSTLVIVYIKPRTTPIDVATRVSDMVHEASRLAVSQGVVRADVVANYGSKARTRIVATAGPNPTFSLQLLIENASPANTGVWNTVQVYTVPSKVIADSWSPDNKSYVLAAKSSDFTTWTFLCYPNGSCDGRSIFFQSTVTSGLDYQARLGILPLGTATLIRKDWN